MKKERCTNCGIKYPENLVQPLVFTLENNLRMMNLCGICALKITNEIHGIKRKRFASGSQAEKARKAAIEWRAALERGEVK